MSNFFTQLAHLLTWPRLCEMEAAGPRVLQTIPNAELQWPAKLSAELPWHSKMTSFGEKFNMPKSPVLDTPLFLDIPHGVEKCPQEVTWLGWHQRSPPYMASLLLFSHPLPATVLGNLQAHGQHFWGIEARCIRIIFCFFLKIPNIP